jgi:hypothetical protein
MLRPNAVLTGRSESGEFDFHYEHNSIGFRDGEHPVKKPDGTFRILGLGDSFTYGIGAAFDQTYLARLEHLLNSRGPGHPPVEVIKAGIPRFFPEAERLLLDRHGLRFGPDLILVAFEPNDVGDTYLGLDALVVGPDGQLVTRGVKGLSLQGERSLALLYRHSHLVRALLQRLATYRAQRPIRWPEVWQDNGLHEADWLEVERQFILMRSAIEGARSEMVLVHIPQKGPFEGGRHHGDRVDEEARLWMDRIDYPPRSLRAWAARHGVRFVDVLPALRAAPGEAPIYWVKDGHCTGFGYSLIADALFHELTAQALVP